MSVMLGLSRRAAAGAGALLLVGCGLFRAHEPSQAQKVAPKAASAPPLRVRVATEPGTNDGGPLYVVLRLTDDASFLAEDYATVAGSLFAEPSDPKLLQRAVVLPVEELVFDVPRPLEKPGMLGVYFMFSVPGSNWRLAVKDVGQRQLRVALGAHEIQSIAEQR